MKCPYCGNPDTKVIDSRPAEDGSSIRRRRACDICGKRFTTYEKIETIPLIIIKKDNNREQYSRQKIENGIMTPEVMMSLGRVGGVELSPDKQKILYGVTYVSIPENKSNRELFVMNIDGSDRKQITRTPKSEQNVMDELKDLDEVAYVRFASVYREFKDVNTFMDELKKILDKEEK